MPTLEIDKDKIYLRVVVGDDGKASVIDQDGRKLAHVRRLDPHYSFDDVATCDINIVLSDGTGHAFVSRETEQ